MSSSLFQKILNVYNVYLRNPRNDLLEAVTCSAEQVGIQITVDLRIQQLKTAAQIARLLRQYFTEDIISTAYAPAVIEPIEVLMEKLSALNEAVFPTWLRLFKNGEKAYYGNKNASCSTWSNKHALYFKDYVDVNARGRICDIGCGPYGVPVYLSSFDKKNISAIEPLKPVVEPDFECVRGFCEFLPWPDGSFDTVISATSLDHVLDLPRALSEIARVLSKEGRLLIWLSSVTGAPKYERTQAEAIDDYHLFHFDKTWAEEMFSVHFDPHDITILPTAGFDHVFYCLQKREG